MADSARGQLRSELLAGLSLAIDLGLGQPMDHMLRSSVLAQRMAGELGLDGECRARIFHSTVLAWIGCHADSFELAHLFGDDIDFRFATYAIDNRGLPLAALMLGHSGTGQPPFQKIGAKARFLPSGRSAVQDLIASHCHSAAALAGALGMGPQMARILICTFERWDGKGLPEGSTAEEIPLEMRVAQLADVAEIFLRNNGLGPAVEMVHLHPFLSERILDRIPGCRRLAALAGTHHEHLNGSGYPRGIRAGSMDMEQRILAAADAFHASLEPRPHRNALSAGDAGVRLQQEVAEGRLDGDAVDAVLRTAGVRSRRRTPRAARLTDREIEVLRLLCQGLGSREIAELLTISPKTVRNHIEHIYEKIEVTNRVGATLFAQRNGLLEIAAT